MYAAIRRYQFDPTHGPEIDRQISEGFVPLLKSSPGFVAYYWIDTGEGTGMSFSVFETLEEANHSVTQASDYHRETLGRLAGRPTVIEGEVTAWG